MQVIYAVFTLWIRMEENLSSTPHSPQKPLLSWVRHIRMFDGQPATGSFTQHTRVHVNTQTQLYMHAGKLQINDAFYSLDSVTKHVQVSHRYRRNFK